MRKVLSFVLVLALVLGSVTSSFASTYFTDAKDNKMATALKDMGILAGDGGKAYLGETITRAEFCAILMNILGYGAIASSDSMKNATSAFTDVKSGTWYAGYINVAASLGYISGYGDGRFGPEDEVTCDEAVTLLMTALGYDSTHLAGDWPLNFNVKFATLQSVKNATADEEFTALYGSTYATREYVFSMLYTVLDEYIVTYSEDTDQFVKSSNNFANILDVSKNNYGTVTGVVTYKTSVAATGLDLTDYLGKNITVYASKGATGKLEIGNALTVLSVNSEEYSGIMTHSGVTNVTTFAGAKVGDNAWSYYAYGNKGIRNGAYTNIDPDEYCDNDTLKIEATAEDSTIVSIFGITYEYCDEENYLVDATEAAYFANGNYTSLNALKAEGVQKADGSYYKIAVATNGAWVSPKLEGVDSLAEIKEGDVLKIYNASSTATYKICVTRNVATGTIKSLKNGVFTLSNGHSYEAINDAVKESITDNADLYASSWAFTLNADGEIVCATVPGINDVARTKTNVYTSEYAFVLKAQTTTNEAFWTQVNGVNVQVEASTSNAIELLPYGATESVVYANVSQAAFGTEVFTIATEEGEWNDSIKDADKNVVVVLTYKDGALCSISAVGKIGDDVDFGSNASSVSAVVAGTKLDNKFIASTVKVTLATSAPITKAASYAAADYADIKGTTVSAYYIVNENGFVSDILVYAQETDGTVAADSTVNYVSYSSVIGGYAKGVTTYTDGTRSVDFFEGADNVTRYITGSATTGELKALCSAQEGSIISLLINKATGKVVSSSAVQPAYSASSACALSVAQDGDYYIVTSSDSAYGIAAGTQIYVYAPTVWVYDEDKDQYKLWTGTLSEAFDECSEDMRINFIKDSEESDVTFIVIGDMGIL